MNIEKETAKVAQIRKSKWEKMLDEFDEMKYRPTVSCENPDETAKKWRKSFGVAVTKYVSEEWSNMRSYEIETEIGLYEEFAKRLKENIKIKYLDNRTIDTQDTEKVSDFFKCIDETLKRYKVDKDEADLCRIKLFEEEEFLQKLEKKAKEEKENEELL